MDQEEGTNGMTIKELMTRESAAAIFAITCAADLEHRQRVMRERADVPEERMIPFFAVMPDGYSEDERRKWIRSIVEALDVVVADAHKDIMVDRTFAMMKDLGLGDDGNGGLRDE